jgi:hypothetical protein
MVMHTAASKLLGLGKLLQSFMHKNPGSVIKVERDAEDSLQRFSFALVLIQVQSQLC